MYICMAIGIAHWASLSAPFQFHFPDAEALPTSATLKPGGCLNSRLKADRQRVWSLDRVSILRLNVGNLVPC